MFLQKCFVIPSGQRLWGFTVKRGDEKTIVLLVKETLYLQNFERVRGFFNVKIRKRFIYMYI